MRKYEELIEELRSLQNEYKHLSSLIDSLVRQRDSIIERMDKDHEELWKYRNGQDT